MNVGELYLSSRSEFTALLARDWELLGYLEQQGFATFPQIKERYFNNHQNCYARLKRLAACGFVAKSSATNLFLTQKERAEGKLFPFISEFNLNPNTQIYYLARKFRAKYAFSEGLLKKEMVLHQLMLNELREFLEKEIPHNTVLTDTKIRVISRVERGRHEKIRPDLSFEFGSFKVAVELERTIKSKARYYERFLYYETSLYTHVIYYTTNRKKLEHLIERARPFQKIGIAYLKSPLEVYHNILGFLSLQTFLRKAQK
jgi:hypothetical protein